MRTDKVRDMVRSILPSKNREGAAVDKRLVKRRVRRTVRHDIHNHETTNRDLFREAEIDVDTRRTYDKVNHFMRWCRALTRGMSTEDALAFVRALVPRNVIGDHAYFHWEIERKYKRFSRASWREQRRRRIQSTIDRTHYALRRAMALDPDFHARLNARIKARKQDGEPRRLLRGIHDVDDFVRTILFAGRDPYSREIIHDRWPQDYAVEKRCLVEMLAR